MAVADPQIYTPMESTPENEDIARVLSIATHAVMQVVCLPRVLAENSDLSLEQVQAASFRCLTTHLLAAFPIDGPHPMETIRRVADRHHCTELPWLSSTTEVVQ